MKKKKYVFLVLGILLLIGIGYAALSANLKINGTSGVKSNKWIIYFDNVQNEKGRIISNATINEDKTEVDFTIELKEPGDLYEFNIDTVNDGTIDAMIESIEMDDIPEKYKDVVTFKVTYSDGTELKECDELNAESRRNLKVYVLYREDIDSSDLPEEDENISLKFKINYTQKGVCTTRNTLNIDPNGGIYNNSDKVTSVLVDKNSTYEVTVPTRSGFIFKEWSLEDGAPLEKDETTGKTTVNIGESNVTIKAVWEVDTTDYVARIENTYYETIQKAIDAAQTGDVIHLLKSTTESPTNNKNVTLNLENFTVTGTLTNTVDGNITLINGEINSSEIALVNNGTVTLGIKDGNYEIDNIRIVGITVGLDQNKNFYFYDGFLQGLIGIEGGCNGKEDGYYIYVDSIKIDNIEYQKVYLIDHVAGNFMTINGEEFYFFSLQYAIASTDNLHPTVYVISENPESSAEVTVAENQVLVLDMNGHTFRYGAHLTNNGKFTINDSSTTKGSFNVSKAIINNNNLIVDNAVINQTDTNENLIENNKNITIEKSTLAALNGNVIYNKNAGTIVLDDDTTLSSNTYAFRSSALDNTILTGGKISGIYVENGKLTINQSTVNNVSGSNTIYVNSNAKLNVKSGTYTSNGTATIMVKSSGELIIDNGIFNNASGTILSTESSSKTIINDGVFTMDATYHYPSGIANNGALTINNGTFTLKNEISNFGTLTINNGTIYTTFRAVLNSATLYINGGTITSQRENAVQTNSLRSGVITVTDGTLISENSSAFNGYGTIIGGTFIGKEYGIYATDTTTIGNNTDEILSNESPVIMGELYGLYAGSSVSVYFYDGILKGKTKGYNGNIKKTPAKCKIVESTETINDEVYNTAYLSLQNEFVQVGNTKFRSLQDAIDAIDEEGTMKLIENANSSDDATIPSGKKINFDLNGKTYESTVSIVNNGELTIEDNSDDKDGLINNTSTYAIETSGTLTVNSGNLLSSTYSINHKQGNVYINGGEIKTGIWGGNGNITVTGGKVYSSITAAIYKNGTGTVNVSGGEVKSTYWEPNTASGIYIKNSSNCVITGGTISADNAYGITSLSGRVIINGGTITSNRYATIYKMYGDVTINDGYLKSVGGPAVHMAIWAGTATINGGTFISENSAAIYNQSTVKINNGTITSNNSVAVNNSGTLTIIDGELNGKSYAISNSSKVILGIDDNVVSKTTPKIIGEEYGIYGESGNIEFYDGIVMGKIGSYTGTIYSTAPRHIVVDDTEEIDGNLYNAIYLDSQVYFAEVGNVQFQDLQDAIDSIESEGTIKIISTASFGQNATIPSGKNITIDLNGKTLNMTSSIINNGTLTVEDNSDDKDGLINNTSTYAIETSGTLTVNSGNLLSSTYSINHKQGNVYINGGEIKTGIWGGIGNITVTGGKVYSSITAAIYKNGTGTVNVSGGEISSTYWEPNTASGIYIKDSSSCVITGGTISASSAAAIRNFSGTITINGGTITSNRYPAVVERYNNVTINGGYLKSSNSNALHMEIWAGTATINGGTFISENSAAIYNQSTVKINDGTFTSNSSSAISNSGTLTVIGGELNGKTYGIYNGGTLTLGVKDGVIDTSTPVIIGETYGLYTSGSSVSIYDGIFKGKTGGYQGTIHTLEDNSNFSSSSEIINEETYNTNFLTGIVEYVQNDRSKDKYNNLQEALTAAQDNDKLIFIDNGSIYYEVTIPNKTLTIDMDGYSINTSKKITNNGVLTIENGNSNASTLSTTAAINLFENNSSLSFDNINLKSTNTDEYIILNNSSGILNLDDTNINSKKLINNVGNNQTRLTNCTYNGTYGISNNNSSLTLSNTDFTLSDWGIYNNKSNLSINGGTIQGESNYKIYNTTTSSSNTLSIKNANIYSGDTKTQVIQNNGISILDIYNTNLLGILYNSGEISYDTGTLTGRINNSGAMTLDNITSTYESNDYFYSSETIINTSTLTISNSSFITYNPNTNKRYNLISNSGNLTLNNAKLEISTNNYQAMAVVSNTGILTYNKGDAIISTNLTNSTNSSFYGVLNSGSGESTIDVVNINIDVNGNTYGVYNSSKVTILGGNISSLGNNSYGVYQESGEMIFGHLEGTGINANPSTTSPLIKAVGTTTGIGVKNSSGTFRYFDGKFVGSTNAKPEAPTQIEEPDYEVTVGTDTDGYNYCILTYLEQH